MDDEQFIKLSEGITETKVLIAANASTLNAIHERQNNVLSRLLTLEENASMLKVLVQDQQILKRVVSLEGSRYKWTGMVAILSIFLLISGYFFAGPIKDIVNVPSAAVENAHNHKELNQKVDDNDKAINGRVDVLQSRFTGLTNRTDDLRDKVEKLESDKHPKF